GGGRGWCWAAAAGRGGVGAWSKALPPHAGACCAPHRASHRRTRCHATSIHTPPRPRHAARAARSPADNQFFPACDSIFSITSLTVKLAALARGGKSLKLSM